MIIWAVNDMRKSKYEPLILEKLENGPASIGTLKEVCGTGNKISPLRKTLNTLLKKGVIELSGYKKDCKSFNTDCFMVKKSESKNENPIYVKGLLDDPLEGDNYFKIQEIFKKRIELINQIYYEDIKRLEDIQGEMPLKEAIDSGYINPGERYVKYKLSYDDDTDEWTEMTFGEVFRGKYLMQQHGT